MVLFRPLIKGELYSIFVRVILINSRYRQIPPFGNGTIQKFHSNVSEMKRLAGRDWEDILQVNSQLHNSYNSSNLDSIHLVCNTSL